VAFHVLDFLIELIVLVEQAGKVVVAGFELGDLVAKFWKHGFVLLKKCL
jgi:hypothetical protein